jgi:hypothetical protein
MENTEAGDGVAGDSEEKATSPYFAADKVCGALFLKV